LSGVEQGTWGGNAKNKQTKKKPLKKWKRSSESQAKVTFGDMASSKKRKAKDRTTYNKTAQSKKKWGKRGGPIR